MYKTCSVCFADKPTLAFYSTRGGFEGSCKQCKNAKTKHRKDCVKNGTHVDTTSNESRSNSFISRSTEIHNGIYSYEKVVYKSTHENVEIFCTLHQGYFFQNPSNHLAGFGCKACSHIAQGADARLTLEGFIERAKSANSVDYDYSKVVYTVNHEKVTIGCGIHGDFRITPSNHMSGRGCLACSRIELSERFAWSLDKFVEKANLSHQEKYCYKKSDYVNALTPISIHCKECNIDFKRTPSNHLSGAGGCPSCFIGQLRGYSTFKAGNLYIMTCGEITKVGITNKHPDIRAKTLSREYGEDFSVARCWTFEDGNIANDIENKILRLLRSRYKTLTARFGGYTECFLDVDMRLLTNEIESQVKAYN